MKAIKNKAISKQKKTQKRSKNWFATTMRGEMRLQDLFILCTQVLVQHYCLGLERRQRVVNDIRRKNDEKRKKQKRLFFYAFVSCLHFVPCYKSKLFETRQKYHKV
jgi:hypothetical protein